MAHQSAYTSVRLRVCLHTHFYVCLTVTYVCAILLSAVTFQLWVNWPRGRKNIQYGEQECSRTFRTHIKIKTAYVQCVFSRWFMNMHLQVPGGCISGFMEGTDKTWFEGPCTQGNNTSISSCNYLFILSLPPWECVQTGKWDISYLISLHNMPEHVTLSKTAFRGLLQGVTSGWMKYNICNTWRLPHATLVYSSVWHVQYLSCDQHAVDKTGAK